MATFYLDFEGGSDAADGTSFANRWRTMNSGATAARIAPGDIIRIMGSPAPTSLGINATWTDRETGAAGTLGTTMTITSSTNASPIVITRAAHGLSNGDTVVVTGHTTNTNANGTWEIANVAANTFELVGSTGNGVGGASGTFQHRTNNVVKLASALTQNIASTTNRGEGRIAWTASANVTATLNTSDFKCSDCSDSLVIAAGFTTGLAAYFDTGTLDLSGYQQVSFWIKQTAGTLGAASSCSLGLYANTAGGSLQNTINIPALGALNQWQVVTVDLATNLFASVDSIGFIVNTDNGAQTFLISNIIACKASSSADSLTLSSLIGKNTGTETWYGIQSINGTRVMLDNSVNNQPTSATSKGYSGTTETVTAYKRETIKLTPPATAATFVMSPQDNGTVGNLIYYEGGYDRTNMSTQNLETWCDGQNGLGRALQTGTRHLSRYNKISFVRFNNGYAINTAGLYNEVTNAHCNNNTTNGFAIGDRPLGTALDNVWACNNLAQGISFSGGSSGSTVGTAISNNNGNTGFIFTDAWRVVVNSLTSNNNGAGTTAYGLSFAGATHGCVIKSLTANKNWGGAIVGIAGGRNYVLAGSSANNQQGNSVQPHYGVLVIKNFAMSEATPVTYYSATAGSHVSMGGGHAQFENFNNTAGDHRLYGGSWWLARNNTTVRHTASGQSWSIAPLEGNGFQQATYPAILPICRIPVAANVAVTVKLWMRRTNTSLNFRLACRGGQVPGVGSDVVTAMTAAADTWEEVTITFTPTSEGSVEIEVQAWGGSTYTGYVDDLSVTPLVPLASMLGLDMQTDGAPLMSAAHAGGMIVGG